MGNDLAQVGGIAMQVSQEELIGRGRWLDAVEVVAEEVAGQRAVAIGASEEDLVAVNALHAALAFFDAGIAGGGGESGRWGRNELEAARDFILTGCNGERVGPGRDHRHTVVGLEDIGMGDQ